MNQISEQQIDQQDGIDIKYMSFDDSGIDYNYFKIPPDLNKAYLHRQAYTVHKTPVSNSQQCLCCNFPRDHIKYNFFEGQKYYHHHSSLGEYFQLIQYCIYQLLIIGILLVPYSSMIYSEGNQCQQITGCDPNSSKVYSVWNLVPSYNSLNNPNYSYLVHFTFLLLQLVHFHFFYNPKITKRMQTAANFEYLRQTCLYFPKNIHLHVVEFMKSRQRNLFQYLVFDLEKYEDVLFEKLKFEYSKQYDKDDKWKNKILIKSFYDNALLDECVTGKIVLMDQLSLFKSEVFAICQIYNQQVQEYQNQDTIKKNLKAMQFILLNLIFSYYLPRALITMTMFFRLKLLTTYFQGDDDKILQGIIKTSFGISQILILKLSDYLCRNGSSMMHQSIQLYLVILQNGLIALIHLTITQNQMLRD
ncbi:unnamed protein product [Paramecium octaurelia]|uniref:Transmembrane protein n=1 Tax=Paramecium octaurelia TaxID=43137 RepID=A0A8S1SHJ3_PAROT|nr:unnamed protein product [Paramecium octaurelia]